MKMIWKKTRNQEDGKMEAEGDAHQPVGRLLPEQEHGELVGIESQEKHSEVKVKEMDNSTPILTCTFIK